MTKRTVWGLTAIVLLILLTLFIVFGGRSPAHQDKNTDSGKALPKVMENQDAPSLPELPFDPDAPAGIAHESREYNDPEMSGISGTVSDALGNMVPFQSVEIIPSDVLIYPSQFFTTTKVATDRNGFYLFKNLHPGQYYFLCGDVREILSVSAGEMLIRNVTLPGSGKLAGEVTDTDGRQVFPANVYLISRKFRFVIQTNESGRFEFFGLPEGDFSLSARADGYVPSTTTQIHLDDLEIKVGIILTMEAGALIEGFVRSETGKPLQGIRISTPRVSSQLGTQMGVSDKQGYFELDGVPPGRQKLQVWVERSYPQPGPVVDVSLDGENVVEIILKTGRRIQGQVESVENIPLPDDLRVIARHHGERSRRSTGFSTSTDEYGEFQFVRLEPGMYRLMIRTHSDEYVLPAYQIIDVNKDDSKDVIFYLERGGVLEGTVRTADENPVKRARLRLQISTSEGEHYSKTVMTRDNGTYRLTGLKDGKADLSLFVQGYIPIKKENIPLQAGETEHLDITLENGSQIWGQVLDRDGNPVQGLKVFARPYGNASFKNLPRDVTGKDGQYQLSGLPKGRYLVYVLFKDPDDSSKLNHLIDEIETTASGRKYQLDFQLKF